MPDQSQPIIGNHYAQGVGVGGGSKDPLIQQWHSQRNGATRGPLRLSGQAVGAITAGTVAPFV